MTNILQVLPGLALVNYLMLDVVVMPGTSATTSSQLSRVRTIVSITLTVLLPTLLASAVLEQLLIARFASTALSTVVFCIVLAAVLQCVALVVIRRNVACASALPILLPLIFGNCIVIGITMPDSVALSTVLTAGFARGAVFSLLLAGFTLLRERLAGADIPVMFQGASTSFIAAAFVSMMLMGFAGLA